MHPRDPSQRPSLPFRGAIDLRPPGGDLDDRKLDFRDEIPIPLSDEALRALLPDDDYEPIPDFDDFWIEQDND